MNDQELMYLILMISSTMNMFWLGMALQGSVLSLPMNQGPIRIASGIAMITVLVAAVAGFALFDTWLVWLVALVVSFFAAGIIGGLINGLFLSRFPLKLHMLMLLTILHPILFFVVAGS